MSQESKEKKELIERCRKGDVEAFDELILLHQDRVYNLALRLLGNPEDALDLSQEVFLRCFRKFKSFRGESSVSTWLYRITVNLAKNFWKRQERTGVKKSISLDQPLTADQDSELFLQVPDFNPGPGKIAEGREILRILMEKLQTLPYDHRQILLLRFSEGLSYDEMAEVLETSLGTVKSRLNRARTELRSLMEPYL